VRWKPLQRSIYKSFVGRTELVWARTNFLPSTVTGEQTFVLAPGPLPPNFALLPSTRATVKPFGYYISGDYQFGRRWFLGGRFDHSQRGACLPTNPATEPQCPLTLTPAGTLAPFDNRLVRDTGGSLLLTYWPSEFSQIRGQLRRTRYGEGFTANEILFQFQFSMGAHGAHPF
jgi:hypothetical protein